MQEQWKHLHFTYYRYSLETQSQKLTYFKTVIIFGGGIIMDAEEFTFKLYYSCCDF